MFTIAHSLTLSLGVLWSHLFHRRFVEPLIALSIVYVAFQNLMTDRLSRHRLPVIFGFGITSWVGVCVNID